MKKLSIITICYNEPNLEKTCESIANQSWQDFEWIVVDGGSNEETLAVFEKYKYRIDKFVSESDNGIYDACNKGIKLATGEYLNFMNAGDCFYNDKVLEKFIKRNVDGDILYGNANVMYKEKSKIFKYPKIMGNSHSLDIIFFIYDNINTQSSFVKRTLFEMYGLFDTKYKIASDYDRWLKFYTKSVKFCRLNFIVANYDMNGISSRDGITDDEKKEIQLKYFSQEEIDKALVKHSCQCSFIEQIFSVKNHKDKCHKILTIFGLKFRFKKKISESCKLHNII